jgi:protein-tyrosine phosphatase
MRYGFADASVEHFDTERLLRVSKWAFERWDNGEQVLIRCQAGLNRSGLVIALTMMHAGFEPKDAIRQIRAQRSEMALFNNHYVTWLIAEAPSLIKAKSSSSAK